MNTSSYPPRILYFVFVSHLRCRPVSVYAFVNAWILSFSPYMSSVFVSLHVSQLSTIFTSLVYRPLNFILRVSSSSFVPPSRTKSPYYFHAPFTYRYRDMHMTGGASDAARNTWAKANSHVRLIVDFGLLNMSVYEVHFCRYPQQEYDLSHFTRIVSHPNRGFRISKYTPGF